MVPIARIERATSPLPRECSATELHGRKITLLPCSRREADTGAGEGNRTLVISLEGFCSTIELHPPLTCHHYRESTHTRYSNISQARLLPETWWRGKDSNLRRLSQQIYSLPPLTAREPLRTKPAIIVRSRRSVNEIGMKNAEALAARTRQAPVTSS